MNLLSETEGETAVSAAVSFITDAVTGGRAAAVGRAAAGSRAQTAAGSPVVFPEVFSEPRGVFVTLTENGELRGCIGYPYPVLPLKAALKDAAYQAALSDPRFYPVRAEELPFLDVEVTILSLPEQLTVPANLRPSAIEVGKHGLIAESHGMRGLLLPQVAAEWGWDAAEFLGQTCIKAGLPADEWQKESCAVSVFEGQIFRGVHPWQ